MKSNTTLMKRIVKLVALITLLATKAFALSKSDFHASVTGIAVVDDYMIYYNEAARANVDFSPPQTHLVVPYGKSILLQISYTCPEEYDYGMALWAGAEKWSADHGGYSGNNPSGRNVGTGTGYGFITLHENRWDSTLESVKVTTSASNFGQWVICTVPVDILFIGGHFIRVDFDSNGVWGDTWMDAQHFYADEPQKLSKNTFSQDGMIFQGWATSSDRAALGIVDYIDEEIITVDSDMTLYAVWTIAPTVYFNPNGARESDWNTQFFNPGEPQKLSKNTYSKDGWVFQGWATTWEKANQGFVDYADEEEITIDSDLLLWAVWTAVPLMLDAETADWSRGSLTLRCADADTSGAVHKYSLFYWNCDALEMMPVENAGAVDVTASADGFAHLTDSAFLSRVGGLETVVYQVKDETGRTCDCVTRERHGLFVGVGDYEKSYKDEHKLSELPGAENDAEDFARIARERGGVTSPKTITGTGAKRQALDRELDAMADKAKPGDICLFYITTHGGMKGTTGIMRLYDGDYTDDRLAGKVARFQEKGAAFVAILGTCYSEGLLQQSYPNVGVIAAAQAENVSDAFFDAFLFNYGWDKGWAGSGETVTFGKLADYAKTRYDALYQGITIIDESKQDCYPMTFQAHIDNSGLLDRIVAGKRGTHVTKSAPRSGAGVSASQGTYQRTIEVSWEADGAADEYLVFYGRGGTDCYLDSINVSVPSYAFKVAEHPWMKEYPAENPVRFEVRAYNGAGIGVFGGAVGWVDAKATPTLPAEWLQCYPATYAAAGGDVAVAAAMTAANGKMTVAECYALGIDPDDKDDDLRIEQFKMVDGQPALTLNHTADGSGNSFLPDVRTFGATSLGDSTDWDDVTDLDAPAAAGYRFFRVGVDIPK